MNTRVFREVEYLSGIDVMLQLKKDFMSDLHIFPDLRDLRISCSAFDYYAVLRKNCYLF